MHGGGLPPIIALDTDEGLLVVDGNHRRDFAETSGLNIPNVDVVETQDDLTEIKPLIPTYSKLKNIEQLESILKGRIK